MTKILGKSIANAKQMSKYLLSLNSSPKFSRDISTLDFCQLFLDICEKEGVRGDIAFAQSLKETGNFKYGGDVKYTQNNFCGLGATGNGVCGCSFKDIETGILAQAQHLKTYATKTALNESCVDPRRTNWFVNAKGGTSPNVETLGGTWAVPGYNTSKYKSLDDANNSKDSYGYQIVDILNKILKINIKEDDTMAYTNSSLVTYTKLSPNKTSPRNHVIDTITIHCYVGQVTAQSGCNANKFVKYNPVSGASCNYVVGYDGSIGLCVEEGNRSWCSSNRANDHRAITIEVASETKAPYKVTDKALDSLIKLCADICKRNNIKELKWEGNKSLIGQVTKQNMTVHRWFAAKSCPGDYLYNKHPYIANEVNKLLGVVPVSNNVTVFLNAGEKIKLVNTPVYASATALTHSSKKNGNFYIWSNIVSNGRVRITNAKSRVGVAKQITGWVKISDINLSTGSSTNVTTNNTSSTSKKYVKNGIDYSLVFDPTYYANSYSDLKRAFGTDATKLFTHFLENGMKEGRQANSKFNVNTYRSRYADLQRAFGSNLIEYYNHYCRYGYKEGRTAV